MENVQTKVCPRCGRDLPLSDYSKGSGKFGRRSIVKSVIDLYIILLNPEKEGDLGD